jgi:hypothetical protein
MFVCLVGLALFLSSRAVLLGVLVTHTPWHPGIRCVAFDVRCVAFAGSPGSALSPVDACEAYAESDAGSGTGSAMDGATAADGNNDDEEGWGVMRMLSGVFAPLFGGTGGGSVAGNDAGSVAGSGSGSGADVGGSVTGSVFNGGSVAGSVFNGGSGSVFNGGSVAGSVPGGGSMVDLDGADPNIDSIDAAAGDTGSVGGWLAALFKTGDQEAEVDNDGTAV